MQDDFPASRLVARNLAVARGGRLLLRNMEFALAPGDALVLTGANGIGKSSLLRVAAGLLRPFAGSMEAAGAMALADQNCALDARAPLGEALGFWARIDHGGSGVDDRIAVALDAMGLAPLAGIPVAMLSTGQTKRAGLAAVLLRDAPIWLLDEPLNGLDRDGAVRLERTMAAHRARGGILIAASHQPLPLDDAARLDLAAHLPEERATSI